MVQGLRYETLFFFSFPNTYCTQFMLDEKQDGFVGSCSSGHNQDGDQMVIRHFKRSLAERQAVAYKR